MKAPKSISIDLRSGPLVAAMGALAAGTLVAAALLGQSLGPIPADHPAIAILPGTGGGAPLVINVDEPSAGTPQGEVLAITSATSLGLADAGFPPKVAPQEPITSLTQDETTEPVPPQGGAIDRVQRVVSDIVDSVTLVAQPHKRGHKDEARRGKLRRTAGRVVDTVGNEAGVGAIDAQPVTDAVTDATSVVTGAAGAASDAPAPAQKEAETAPTETVTDAVVPEPAPSG